MLRLPNGTVDERYPKQQFAWIVSEYCFQISKHRFTSVNTLSSAHLSWKAPGLNQWAPRKYRRRRCQQNRPEGPARSHHKILDTAG